METTDKHSRRVKFLTYALPLLAVAMLSLIFMLDWSNSDEVTKQFSDEDGEFNPEMQAQVESPTLTAKNAQGDEVNLSAQTLQRESDENDNLLATSLEGQIQVGGSEWQIESTEGETDSQGRMAEFRGRVLALIDGQYNLLGSQVVADVTERTFTSEFPIEVKSDKFDLEADSGSMQGARGERRIELNGNVKGVIRMGKFDGKDDE